MTEATSLKLTACYDDRHPEVPLFFEFSVDTLTEEGAQEFAAQFPKSCKIAGGRLGGSPTHKGHVHSRAGGLAPNASRGARNETAIKRYRSIVRTCDKLGIKIEYSARWVNSYPTREAFEAAAIG